MFLLGVGDRITYLRLGLLESDLVLGLWLELGSELELGLG